LSFHSGREADHSPPSSAEVKEWAELYLHSPNTPSWRGAQLGGAQTQLYLFFYLLHFINVRLNSVLFGRNSHKRVTNMCMYEGASKSFRIGRLEEGQHGSPKCWYPYLQFSS
jgi:hypothetical protein